MIFKAYDDQVQQHEEIIQNEERIKRHKSENRFHKEKSRDESPSFFDRWDQDGGSRNQSRLEREVSRILKTAKKEESNF